MQGQKNALDSFPETVDLNQGSVTNNADMDHSSSWNNMLNPVENRLSNYAHSSGEGSFSCLNPVTHNGRSFSDWDLGESSSSAGLQNQNQNQVCDDGLTMDHDWSSTERQYDDPSVGNSSRISVNVNLNTGYNAGDIDITRDGLYPNFYKPDVSDVDQMPPVTGSDDVGTSSDDLGSWGLSCKRKSIEGTSSSSCIPPVENIQQGTVAPRQHSSSSLNISSPQLNLPALGRFEQQLNSRIGTSFPPLLESSHRNYGVRINPGSQEPVRRSAVRSPYQSRIISVNDTVDFRPTSSVSNSHVMHLPGLPRNVLPHSWNNNGGFNSRPGSASSSLQLRDETSNFRAGLRNNSDHAPLFDQTNWNLATGSSRPGPSLSSRSFPTVWIPHHHHSLPAQNPQRLNEFSPWSLFPPPVESEAGGQRGHFPPYAAGPSSSPEDTMMSSGSNGQGHHQTYPRSLLEVPDDVNTSWRALAADIEGRQRLVSEIRQVLNAMRRGERLRAEDYMLFDPLINGVAELHDRHRDMRLDVDNMSYEELLALEERIGDVNTGLSEEKILKTMKQQKYLSITFGVRAKLEPCCICQEEYVNGDDIGTLECGHDFHTDCIKQWLMQKNVCPICKMAGLGK